MQTLQDLFIEALTQAIQDAFPNELAIEEQRADISACAQEEFGHYQCNSAMRLAKLLKTSPRQVAQKLLETIPSQFKAKLSKAEIAGPGFLNFSLSSGALGSELEQMKCDPLLGTTRPKKERVIVEFSSPNIAKELHVGHLRSTIIGDCLARLMEFLGHEVIRLNHIGDWGTQFGMLIRYLKLKAPEILQGKKAADLQVLLQHYRAAKVLFDEDPTFKKEAQLEVVQLQSGNPESLQAWKMICDISRTGFQEIYDLLDVKIQERGESFYNPQLKQIVEELEQKHLVTISNGAKCIFLDGFKNREGEPLPLMIQKSDGGYNYDTTDMAAIKYRIFEDRADRIIVVTDNGQSLHFQLVFAAAEKAGWLDRKKTRVDHVGFGLVLGTDGKKFKTRSGHTEKLIDLLYEAIDQAKQGILERNPEQDPATLEQLAKTLGIGAVKYADLSSHRTKDYTFSYERMLRFEGNTAVFLLYAYVRICGIQRKVGEAVSGPIRLTHPSELSLALHLRRFGEALESVANDLLPNRLAEYLYELAEKFNAFFRDCRVEGSPEEASRLSLCQLTGRVLKQGLEILGLKITTRM